MPQGVCVCEGNMEADGICWHMFLNDLMGIFKGCGM